MFHKTQQDIMRNWHIGLESNLDCLDSKQNQLTESKANLYNSNQSLKPLCSFLCITYNHIDFIEQCLIGFLEQETTFPFEIIIHDDCSTDGTDRIIKEYQSKYPQIIKAMYEEENQYSKGDKGKPFWAIMHNMAGKYIALCEGDDYWNDIHKIQKQVAFLESNPEFVGCYHECIMPKDNSHILYDNLDRDKVSSGLSLQRREVFMSLRTLCYRNVIDYSQPIISHYLQRIFNGDVFVNALLGAYGSVKFLSDINPSYYRLHAGGIYSSLANEDRVANSVRSLYYISSYYAKIGKPNLSSLWLQESIQTFIRQQPIILMQADCEALIKSLYQHYHCTLPLKLALRMVFPSVYNMLFGFRDWLRKYRQRFIIKADISKIYYKEFKEERIPKTLNNFLARKIQRFQNKRFVKYRLNALQNNINNFFRLGVLGVRKFADKSHKPELIVSFTSYPKRISQVFYTAYSLLTQTHKPDKVILWLSSDEFPNKKRDLPNSLLSFQRFGLEIAFVEGNLKSYKKIVYALDKYRDCVIVIADDDALYPNDWLEKLFLAYTNNPSCIHCNQANRIGLDSNNSLLPYVQWRNVNSADMGTKNDDVVCSEPSFIHLANGLGGVLYPPNCLYRDVLDSSLFMSLCPLGDDIWLWAMALLQGTKIHVIEDNYKDIFITDWTTQDSALWRTNCDEGYNDVQLKNVIAKYPVLYSMILESSNHARDIESKHEEIKEITTNAINYQQTLSNGGGGGNPLNFKLRFIKSKPFNFRNFSSNYNNSKIKSIPLRNSLFLTHPKNIYPGYLLSIFKIAS